MKQADFHFEFNPFLTNLYQRLQNLDIQSQNVQLEIKYGFMKHNKNESLYKSLVNSSQIRPIDLNEGKNKFNFKVNARCSLQEHSNARSILDELAERGCVVEEKHHLHMNQGEEKYLYDCRYEEWSRHYKEQLVKWQSNFLFKNRLFRLDLSEKIKEEKHVLDKIKLIFGQREKATGVLRFKHINVYKVHEFYEVWSSLVFQTDDENWFTNVKKLIYEQGDNVSKDVKAIIEKKEKEKHEIKHQLELKFTQQGIDALRQQLNSQTKAIFSNAFDFFTEITLKKSRSQLQLIRMIKDLGLQEEEKLQKEQKKTKQGGKVEQTTKEEKPTQNKSGSKKQEEIQYIVKK